MKPRHDAIPRRIMTAVEVAQHLKIHPNRVYKLARNGQIPAFKIGADYRFYGDAIEKLSPIESERERESSLKKERASEEGPHRRPEHRLDSRGERSASDTRTTKSPRERPSATRI
jgi:excisionase family DNA binding protein